jgi:amyloid beta precursor protein binding protein 1
LFKNDTPFTLILYTFPIAPKILALVEEYSQHRQTPLISIISAGFYSYFRLQLPGNFPIVDTHPDSTATTDLRLLSPWQELTAFAREQTAEIDTLDAHEHGHIPYLVLLLHYLEEWKLSHSGTPPKTYSEKNEFKKLVTAAARTDNAEGGEENYDEAVAAVMKNISASTLPSSVREVFEYKPDMVRVLSPK